MRSRSGTLALSMAAADWRRAAGLLDNTRFASLAPSVRFGVTSWGLLREPSVSIGLTGPGRSFAFGLTFPYAF
jgi:hypothetical protein